MAGNVCSDDVYITAGFRTLRDQDEYYVLFMKKECVVYTRNGNKILKGPAPIVEIFPSLKCTIFEDAGVDCAFASHNPGNKAFIFAYSMCAELDYGQFQGDDKIVDGPKPISQMFPFLQNSVFEIGLDAAFELDKNPYQAFVFKGDQCARIYYGPNANAGILRKGSIVQLFPLAKGRPFASNNDSALSHKSNQGFFVKGIHSNHIYAVSSNPNDGVPLGEPLPFSTYFPAVAKILPRKKSAQK